MPVIFLDFDGPMITSGIYVNNLRHHEDHKLIFCETAVQSLNWLIEETQSKIVISSAWRMMGGRVVLQEFLTRRGVKGKVIGRTVIRNGTDTFLDRDCRGNEIAEFKNRHWTDGRYVILDDDNDMLPHQMPFFVQCNFDRGLTLDEAVRAAEILKGTA